MIDVAADVLQEGLRRSVTALLRKRAVLQSLPVEQAIQLTPRSRFVGNDPQLTLEDIYDLDRAIGIKFVDGARVSSVTCLSLVVELLELAALEPGHMVLEVGGGLGYNAALIGRIVGPSGSVRSIEFDADLVGRAASAVEDSDLKNVTFVCGDGAAIDLPTSHFDRIFVSVASPEIAPNWICALKQGGILLAVISVVSECYVLRGCRVGDELVVDLFQPIGFWNRMRGRFGDVPGWFPAPPHDPQAVVPWEIKDFREWFKTIKSAYYSREHLQYPLSEKALPVQMHVPRHPFWVVAHLEGFHWLLVFARYAALRGEPGILREYVFASGRSVARFDPSARDYVEVFGSPEIFGEIAHVQDVMRSRGINDSTHFEGSVIIRAAEGLAPDHSIANSWNRSGIATDLTISVGE